MKIVNTIVKGDKIITVKILRVGKKAKKFNAKEIFTSLKDNEKNGIEGVICGRAIYEGKIDITEANKIFEIN